MKPINKLFFAAITSCSTIFLLFLLVMIEGCSNNSSGPPDLSLTLDIVSKNPGSYKGKRVKWLGQIMSLELREKGKGMDVIIIDPNSISVDPFGSEFQNRNAFDNVIAFSVESDTIRGFTHDDVFWVTGTVKGNRKIKPNFGNPHDIGRKEEMEVPVLVDAQFEKFEYNEKNR